MNTPLGVSPIKGKQGTTRGKEKIFWPRWESNPRPPSDGRSNPEVVGSILTWWIINEFEKDVLKNRFISKYFMLVALTPCSSLRSRHTTVTIMYVFYGDESQ